MSHDPANLLAEDVPRRIAVVRALQLGDVLCAVPALRALRRACPEASITFVGLPWARAFVERFHEYVDEFLELPGFPGLPERSFDAIGFRRLLVRAHAAAFDLAIQLQGSGALTNPLTLLLGARHSAGFYVPGQHCPDPRRFMPYPSSEHEIWRNLRLMEFLGAPPVGDELEFPLLESDRNELSSLPDARELRWGDYVCIHPGARYHSRRWPTARYAQVADRLAEQGLQVVVTGSNDEAALADEVCRQMHSPALNLSGRTSLGAVAALLSRARLLISNDTGVSHIAAGLKVPSVVLVLGSDPSRWLPLDRRRHRGVRHEVDCQPCGHVVCPIDFRCAEGLSVEAVLSAANDVLETFEAPGPLGRETIGALEGNLCEGSGTRVAVAISR